MNRALQEALQFAAGRYCPNPRCATCRAFNELTYFVSCALRDRQDAYQHALRSVESLRSTPCASPDFLAGIERAALSLRALAANGGPLTTRVD